MVAVRTLDAMPALESLPSKIGPYRVVEKIGEGGMGVVWRALDTTLDREAKLPRTSVSTSTTR